MLEQIRNFLLTLTAIGTVVGFFIKTVNDFFMKSIRKRYKNVPGKQTIFEIIVEWIAYIIVFIYLFVAGTLIITSIANSDWHWVSANIQIGEINYGNFVGIAIVIAFFFSICAPIFAWSSVSNLFILKLEKGLCHKVKRITKKIITLGVIASSITTSGGIYLIWALLDQKVKLVVKNSSYFLENNLGDDDMKMILLVGFALFFTITAFIILNSLKEICKVIDKLQMYILCTSKENIICRCYLEYDEYYLLFENGTERYIKKSEVKEIKKK
ncbi:hypothetical protein [Clostridium sp. HBUAS56017]|uniref:hypothetical protein n=1 Tax=Clostridium sp. HBUAS56017 TaxID=2571128 RepID=UPI001177CE86|nr:hypothetical protein [Clostridium sp. HBUAS56017]